ncbi:hypothetical protein OPV22_032343 [Ensete ventricosum]|uniref:Integrase zinc-binding domain-containing protein n=1 Tax=Ensete ventricosum TaxID=4639 RepID=A0AAV8PWC2_ENSVE|nr:hypothetical protein OPV22_032343 [Ensete ventricosum]
MALVERAFYWPKIGTDVEECVRTCLTCQQDKVEQQKPVRLLEPLPVLERPWESISLDFISSLPAVGGLGSILVVVDQFSKYVTFIAAPLHCSVEDAAKLISFARIQEEWLNQDAQRMRTTPRHMAYEPPSASSHPLL